MMIENEKIEKQIANWKEKVSPHTTLIAVSKEQPIESIQAAYQAGQRHFAENKVQSLLQRKEQLPLDIHWHMIGHLQRNKVKFLVPFIHLIHSLDRPELLAEIEKEAAKHNRLVRCLVQVNLSREEQKFGLPIEHLSQFLSSKTVRDLKHTEIVGLMGMASHTTDHKAIRKEFTLLRETFDTLGKNMAQRRVRMTILSMGMTSDYEIALTCGSNMIRIGESIFGKRRRTL